VSTIEEFREEVRAWLAAGPLPRTEPGTERAWGEGSDSVAVFHDLPHEEERALLDRMRSWQRTKHDAGYGAIDWPVELGGRGLPAAYDAAFREEELAYDTGSHELVAVTLGLVAPTLRELASDELRDLLVGPMLRGELLACQLFSEPSAGSDLANVSTRATRTGEEWVVNGQKVWTSGAQFADWGELVVRTDPDAPKHRGLTAFMVPLDAEGIEIRPLRQMTGGTSFNEVFLDDVRIPDRYRIGEVGDGWRVALTTLGFERGNSAEQGRVGGDWRRAVDLCRHTGAIEDPHVRQLLAEAVIAWRLGEVANARDERDHARGGAPGAIGSVRKLQWVHRMASVSDVARAALGPRLAVDDGQWGTWAWTQQLLGVPGYRIAGGSDEIQKNIIGERLLGLPPEPREARDQPWRTSSR
jgi:alkylation response protein AidB-like acyl-CoA dehydrogenase